MGGFGTWVLASHSPNRFAAIVPICGGGDPFEDRKRIAHIPAWVFHGGKDPAVPVENSKKMVEALKKNGGDPKLTIYPEAGIRIGWVRSLQHPRTLRMADQQKRTTKNWKTPRSDPTGRRLR